ncbi:MAG: hypothetical protein M3Z64_07525 [Verrucomicrobiota bacterium]|nr:hypothetical protein [Verrucomicrobiota bacterium]
MDASLTGQIIAHRDDPEALEKLYCAQPSEFAKALSDAVAADRQSILLRAWQVRLAPREISTASDENTDGRGTISLVIFLCAIAGLIAKLPAFFPSLKPEEFYPRNLAFAVLGPICAYFIARQAASWRNVALIAGVFVLAAITINAYPGLTSDQAPHLMRDSVALACLHLPLFLWTVGGFAFAHTRWRDSATRIGFLRFNGEMLINWALINIAGTLTAGITIALFAAIKLDIADWYFKWPVVFGACAAPIVATHLAISRAGRLAIAPLLARIFSPLALVTLAVYLGAMAVQRRSPYADREFLLVFNIMLVAVLGIAVFCICQRRANRFFDLTIWTLVCVAIVIDLVALSAIVARLSHYGFTPNRTVTLVSNILILANLGMIVATFTKSALRRQEDTSATQRSIAWFLPIYSAWTAFVVFALPAIFRFR